MDDTHGQPLFDPLTEREIEILRLIAEGFTNREIAQELVITLETVKWYNKQIYSKLGVHSRTQAVVCAREVGLLDAPPDVPAHPAISPKHNLPAQVTSFIGREREIGEVMQLLAATRLLTLTGPPGTGKTRLGLQVAAQILDRFADGVFFVMIWRYFPASHVRFGFYRITGNGYHRQCDRQHYCNQFFHSSNLPFMWSDWYYLDTGSVLTQRLSLSNGHGSGMKGPLKYS